MWEGRGGENGEEEEEMGKKEIIRNLRSERNRDKNNSRTTGVIWKHNKKIKKNNVYSKRKCLKY